LTIRERAGHSELVAAFERDVVALLRLMLVNSLRECATVNAERVDDAADAVMALCEGVLLRDFNATQRRRVLRFGVERLIGGEVPAATPRPTTAARSTRGPTP